MTKWCGQERVKELGVAEPEGAGGLGTDGGPLFALRLLRSCLIHSFSGFRSSVGSCPLKNAESCSSSVADDRCWGCCCKHL